ncbi:hypothetical protein Y032_0007g3214 [Ancylostoma ceylanicum]|uniref:Uncharacterized protein n=1 Tax=Ancylostoma ceylanicum TaxID=53326 RepID=A0A016VNR7_9BILA|nr:hypothetical protein Y032_0007g3214 [Ancylostoma ceylanicum]
MAASGRRCCYDFYSTHRAVRTPHAQVMRSVNYFLTPRLAQANFVQRCHATTANATRRGEHVRVSCVSDAIGPILHHIDARASNSRI